MRAYLVLLSLWALIASACVGKLEDEQRSLVLLGTYSLTANSHLNITISSVSLTTFAPLPDDEDQYRFNMGVVIAYGELMPDHCAHEVYREGALYDVIALASQTVWGHRSYITTLRDPATYYVYFSNCEPSTAVSLKYTITPENPPMASAFAIKSVVITFVAMGATLALLLVWLFLLVRNYAAVGPEHWAIVALTTLSLFGDLIFALRLIVTARVGYNPHLVATATGTRAYCALLLVFALYTGWKRTRYFMLPRATVVAETALASAGAAVGLLWLNSAHQPLATLAWYSWLRALLVLSTLTMLALALYAARAQPKAAAVAGTAVDARTLFREFALQLVLALALAAAVMMVDSALQASAAVTPQHYMDAFWEASKVALLAAACFVGRPQRQHKYVRLPAGELPAAPSALDGDDDDFAVNGGGGRNSEGDGLSNADSMSDVAMSHAHGGAAAAAAAVHSGNEISLSSLPSGNVPISSVKTQLWSPAVAGSTANGADLAPINTL